MSTLELLLITTTAAGFFLAGLYIGEKLGAAKEAGRCLYQLRKLNLERGWNMEVIENE